MTLSLRCLELVLAFLVQALVTMRPPGLLSSLGGGLIITGITILACEERLARGLGRVITAIRRRAAPRPDTEDTPLLL